MHPNARPLQEAQRQLQLLLEQQELQTPALYRDLALYLQVLRQSLLHAVQQACFHLATQVVPDRYAALPPSRRQGLQRRLQQLVQRCNALLTVEQLIGLAAQQLRRQARVHQQRWLEGLQDPAAAASEPAAPPAPQGSITLGLDLPVAADLFEAGVPGLPPLSHRESPSTGMASARSEEEGGSELKLLQSLFSLAAEGLGQSLPEPAQSEAIAAEAPSAPSDELSPELGLDDNPLASAALRELGTQPPRDPLAQLRWWSQLDGALRRRLRNLSHAVNVELMRHGLAQGLLPLNLLDAVLQGQVEALPAPANLLRLPVPIPEPLATDRSMDVISLLLRTSDLEYEHPPLRTCRRRLEQRRRELRTMAERYRYWQRRVSALEAEQQWLQDSAQLQTPLDRP